MPDTRVFRALHFPNRRREVVSEVDPTPINVQPGEILYDEEENKLYAGLEDTTVVQVGGATGYSQTLIVDPAGDDVNGNGGSNAPFQTLQKAHDYAAANIEPDKRVVVKVNSGDYAENLTVTRTRTSFVGLTEGISKATRLAGTLTINTSASIGGAADDMVSFENLLIAANSNVITVAGSFAHTTLFKDCQIYTFSANANCLNVTNNAEGGNIIYVTNCTFTNQQSSAATIEFLNTAYANINGGTFFNGTGKAINITTTDAVVANSRFESASGAVTMICANSSFNPGKPALVVSNAWIVNPSANGNGIEIASGATTNVGQVAFSVGSSAGTGFAVKGVAGAVFVNGGNLIVPGTNNKISTAITRVALGTALTPA